MAVIAALLGFGEIEIFAQRIEERGPGPKRYAPLDAIHA
jgi:hypothetical protein